jgi:hypothetical protein
VIVCVCVLLVFIVALIAGRVTSRNQGDVFVVVSKDRDGKRVTRTVLAGDEDQARLAHYEAHPDDHIIGVRPHR